MIFATYEGCDPLAAGLITEKDQILPFFVLDRLSTAPGLPGLFVACMFSGSLRYTQGAEGGGCLINIHLGCPGTVVLGVLLQVSHTRDVDVLCSAFQ